MFGSFRRAWQRALLSLGRAIKHVLDEIACSYKRTYYHYIGFCIKFQVLKYIFFVIFVYPECQLYPEPIE